MDYGFCTLDLNSDNKMQEFSRKFQIVFKVIKMC